MEEQKIWLPEDQKIIVDNREAETIIKQLKNKDYYEKLSSNEQMMEWMKCKMEPLYFVENFCYAPVAGGNIRMGDSEQWLSSNKFRLLIKLFHLQDNVAFISSRQIGKTTLMLMFFLWAMIFFPKVKVSFLTLDGARGKDAVSRLQEVMRLLPKFLQIPQASKAERTTYYYLKNGSKFDTMFVSGSIDPDTLGRGLSGSLIGLDEAAFIRHMDIVYGAMQPSIATAKIHAKNFGYPTTMIAVSTPNGAGSNWFYGILQRSIKFDDVYDYENKCMYSDAHKQFEDEEKNAFISMKILWSETHRTEEWYNEQRKELNFNQRKINQELDLVFLGSSTSIFSDDIISKLVPKKSIHNMQLPFGHNMKLFTELDPNELYLLGVDTAMSAGSNSDFSALSLTHARSGQEVGVWKGKFSVVKRLAALVKAAIKGLHLLYGLDEEHLRVVIERNSIGKETVEELIYNDPEQDDFDYPAYVWQEQVKDDEYVYGLYTSNAGKMGNGKRDQMFNELMNQVNAHPDFFHSDELIDELRNLEQKPNGRIEASRGQHDDVTMAFNFTLYVRKLMIKSGEITVDGETLAFSLTPERMMDFIGVSLGSGTHIESYEEMIYQEDYQEFGVQFTSEKKRVANDSFNLNDYIIGI